MYREFLQVSFWGHLVSFTCGTYLYCKKLICRDILLVLLGQGDFIASKLAEIRERERERERERGTVVALSQLGHCPEQQFVPRQE
jgi:hypothetical protein